MIYSRCSAMYDPRQSHSPQVYALRCVRCGNGLELPADPRAVHIDSYCGQDNVLPDNLIQARMRQYDYYAAQHAAALDHRARQHAALMEYQARQRAAAADYHARQPVAPAPRNEHLHRSGATVILACVIGIATFVGFCSMSRSASEADRRREALTRRNDPFLNGRNGVVARIQRMREYANCDHVVSQVETYEENASLSFTIYGSGPCLHIVAETNTPALLELHHLDGPALDDPTPSPTRYLDYRACAATTGDHRFSVKASSAEPFSVAALSCPR